MTNKPPRARILCLGLALAVLAGLGVGCRHTSAIEFVSYKDPYFPERYQVDFDECAYQVAPGGDIHATGRARTSTDNGLLTQLIHVHVYWRPWPGKTSVNETTTTALLRYAVATETGVAVYSGTGFALPKKMKNGKLRVQIESGRLRLESQSGDVPDLLGDARLVGTLILDDDPGLASHLTRELELLTTRP